MERWSTEALKWACCSSTRHAASRSHQVFCALSPRLTSPASTALLFCLEKCLRNATSQGLDTAIEILCTLRVLLGNTTREKMVLYPHIFAACIALLNSSVVRVGELAMAMLVQLLEFLDFSDPSTLQTFLTFYPSDRITTASYDSSSKWIVGTALLGEIDDIDEETNGPWMALQQLLVKGLFQPDTEGLALQAFGAVSRQMSRLSSVKSRTLKSDGLFNSHRKYFSSKASPICHLVNIEAILGDAKVGISITIAATLPWIFVRIHESGNSFDDISGFLFDLSHGCESLGWSNTATLLLCLENDPNTRLDQDTSYSNWAKEMIPIIAEDMFPDFSYLFLQRIIETVQRAPEHYQKAALYILEAFFSNPGIRLGNVHKMVEESHLVSFLSLEISSDLGGIVLKVLEAISNFKGKFQGFLSPSQSRCLPVILLFGSGDVKDQSGVTCSWKCGIDEIGECNKICSVALKRVVQQCPGNTELQRMISGDDAKPGDSYLLPFLPDA